MTALQTTLLVAFNSAVEGNPHVEDVDSALVETGRAMAKAIDDIIASPEANATDKTKALYLVPHLVAILRELLATPAARKQMGLAAAEQKKGSRIELIKGQAKRAKSE